MGESVTIQTQAGPMAAYLARPSRTPAPAVVVIQEIFGVNEVMRGVADGLAAAGYLAVCPDLFWRIEPGVQITDRSDAEWRKAFELYKAFDVDLGVEDVGAAIDHARADPACSGKVGTVGFCLGGLLAFLAAGETDADASVSYYGVGVEAHTSEADAIVRPLLMHIAEEDEFTPKAAQTLILTALKNHPQVELHTYPGRGHAFARAGGAHYHEADAKLAEGRSLSFLAKHLG